MLVLLFVGLWFILRGDLFYVLPCVIHFVLVFFGPLTLRLPRLGKRELTLVLFVRLFDLCLFGFVAFLFLLVSAKGCGLWLWHSLDFSLTCFLTLCCFVVYSTRRFVLCFTLCYFVLVFFSPSSIAITSLGEERAYLGVFRTFVWFVLVWICRFPLPLGVWEGLRLVIVALPGLFFYLFSIMEMSKMWKLLTDVRMTDGPWTTDHGISWPGAKAPGKLTIEDLQDGCCGRHRRYRYKMILTILKLHVASMPPSNLPFGSRWDLKIFKMAILAAILEIGTEWILAIRNVYVASLPPIKCWLNPHYSLGDVILKNFKMAE